MRLECHVTQVQDNYPQLKVTLQDNANWKLQEITMSSTKAARQSYYIGRKVIIEVRPA
jgi:hypothetical protein